MQVRQAEDRLQQVQPNSRQAAEDARVAQAVAEFAVLPDCALVSRRVIERVCSISAATVWNWVKAQRLPAPVCRGKWSVGQLRASPALSHSQQ